VKMGAPARVHRAPPEVLIDQQFSDRTPSGKKEWAHLHEPFHTPSGGPS
jgi:hypothetical protein